MKQDDNVVPKQCNNCKDGPKEKCDMYKRDFGVKYHGYYCAGQHLIDWS